MLCVKPPLPPDSTYSLSALLPLLEQMVCARGRRRKVWLTEKMIDLYLIIAKQLDNVKGERRMGVWLPSGWKGGCTQESSKISYDGIPFLLH